MDALKAALDSPALIERQAAIQTLGSVNDERATELLRGLLEKLLAEDLPAEIQLDVQEAVTAHDDSGLKDKLDSFEKNRHADEPLDQYRSSLAGGDALRGRQIFFERAEVSCVRCHKVEGVGGEVGPDLSKIGSQKPRDYLLEAIVQPNKAIAKGFESVAVIMDDGLQHSGVLKTETEDELQVVTAEGALMTIDKDAIDARATGKSPMPEDVVKHLSRRDLRDLVQFLSELK